MEKGNSSNSNVSDSEYISELVKDVKSNADIMNSFSHYDHSDMFKKGDQLFICNECYHRFRFNEFEKPWRYVDLKCHYRWCIDEKKRKDALLKEWRINEQRRKAEIHKQLEEEDREKWRQFGLRKKEREQKEEEERFWDEACEVASKQEDEWWAAVCEMADKQEGSKKE